ncbi:MAG: hypothetical protein HC896_10520 [Bacteroidales bacterium]|nr:hypothetical protein [Bacteroidales bacterium]
MKKALYLFSILLSLHLASFNHASAYSWLTINDPQNPWWYNFESVIDSAELTIEPQGIYMEYNLVLTVSSLFKGSYYNDQTEAEPDSLEIHYYFNLPDQAIVNDSWLWIGDTIIKAELMDKWRAYGIYEGIVQRRKDPSVLYKQSSTGYELNVYPLRNNGSRKFKISWLMPTTWGKNTVNCALPMEMLNAAGTKPNLKLNVATGPNWEDPGIAELPQAEFQLENGYKTTTIDLNNNYNNLTLSLKAPYQNGIYLATYQSPEGNNYYQMALLPHQVIDLEASKDIVFVVDYEKDNTNINKKSLLEAIESCIINSSNFIGSFNIVISGVSPKLVSPNWLNASDTNINSTLAK